MRGPLRFQPEAKVAKRRTILPVERAPRDRARLGCGENVWLVGLNGGRLPANGRHDLFPRNYLGYEAIRNAGTTSVTPLIFRTHASIYERSSEGFPAAPANAMSQASPESAGLKAALGLRIFKVKMFKYAALLR